MTVNPIHVANVTNLWIKRIELQTVLSTNLEHTKPMIIFLSIIIEFIDYDFRKKKGSTNSPD